MESKKVSRSQGGFTLIEIIAVLVLLGILAAVAVPRFTDLQSDARVKALDGAFAAGMSQATMAYSQYLLQNGAEPASIADNAWTGSGDEAPTVAIPTDLGDFTVSYATGDDGVTVTIADSGSPDWVTDITTADDKSRTFKLGSFGSAAE